MSELPQSLADSQIPALQAVLDPRELGEHLNRVLPPQWGLLRDIQIRVLKHHRRRRCVVDLTLQTTTGKHELIGKVYATDRSDVYRAMAVVSQSGFGPEAEFSIPQPLAYLPELHLLLQEKVHGQHVTEIFSKGSKGERARATERCAKWLAHFHMHAPMSGPVFVLTHEVMEGWANRLDKPVGWLADKARLLFQRLEIAASALGPTEMCPCHGGYWHEQIILTEARVVTLDWDNHCIAHPSRDIAKFIIELQQLALYSHGSMKALDTAIEAFYQTYTNMSRYEVATSLPLYKASICLKRAKCHLRPRGGGLEKAGAMLDEGLRILAEGKWKVIGWIAIGLDITDAMLGATDAIELWCG
jgi:hypothetical protein